MEAHLTGATGSAPARRAVATTARRPRTARAVRAAAVALACLLPSACTGGQGSVPAGASVPDASGSTSTAPEPSASTQSPPGEPEPTPSGAAGEGAEGVLPDADAAPGNDPAEDGPAEDGPAEARSADAPGAPGVTDAPGAPGVTDADREAGVRTMEVAQAASGETDVVPGASQAPGPGPQRSVRVEVERGLDVDAAAFAGFVLTTLNDPRGWGADGSVSFARTDGPADIRLVLASPDTSRRMCRPLETFGKLSCRTGDTVVLTSHRWTLGIEDYGEDRTAYRQYLVTHEVGHFLGHDHVSCPGVGRPAPTMMQQTKGLKGCLPNPWPNP
ncbi:uncharacterized protein DUF3152 [Kineococcus xinjiangensis]|uniref:Uncharacterized protein DUF3152 n=1 Tax=Kineococcus xinjiangensis TaxID=512762 RepID=A0A2S6IWN8_9ACTN|nr:DUF3152 domain-containing protein [Kineococcus xinjiangensis]PPK98767.1 uncharacterized protein DUF3152 [Kineococcus xinjiangensis]